MLERTVRMLRPAVARDVLVAGALGAAAGAVFGLGGSGWLMPLVVGGLAWRLTRPGVTPQHAAAQLACFSTLLCLAGHGGAVLALPAPWRLLGWLPLVALIGVQAAGSSAVGLAAFAWRVSPALRMGVLLPSLWTAMEGLLACGDAALPWLRIGYAQGAGGPLVGALPIGGVLLAGWLTWSVAGLAALACRPGAPRRALAAAAAGMVLIATVAGQVEWTRPGGTLRLALLQPGGASTEQHLGWYAARLRDTHADLLVTPQLALPKTPSALPPGYLSQLDTHLRQRGADALVGLHLPHAESTSLFNGVIGLGRSGPQVYRKQRLFPFGEFLPLPPGVVRSVQAMLPVPLAQTARGPVADMPLWAAGHRVALALCWEAAFGDTWRASAATADLLLNLSSDSALDSRQLARQVRHVVQARARELQKPLVRTSDLRGTFVVDAAGRVVDELPEGTPGILQTTVQTRTGLTPYARWGDRAAWGWLALSLAIVALGGATPRPVLHRRLAVTGQVLPLAALLLVAIGAAFYLMVNSGQAVQEKIRVTNAADAAAYSAAVAEARALNYDAYLNRAIVANEISIAQMVSFASWLRYFATASDEFGANAADINFFLLPNAKVAQLDVAFGGSAAVAAYLGGRRVGDYAEAVIQAIGALISAHDAAVRALALSQQAVHASLAAGVRQRQIANTVVRAMDPALQADILPASHGFDTFTRAYARAGHDGDERGRLADVTVRSRDAFTRERNWTVTSFGIPLVRKDPALKKRGGTDLVGYDEWRAVDTLELHGRTWGCGKWGLSWCDDIQRPIGWGAVAVLADGTGDARGWHGNAYGDNPTTAARAESDMRAPSTAVFSGLPDTRDVDDIDPTHAATTGLTVRVIKPLAATHTAGRAADAQPGGRLALFGGTPVVDEIAALSRAEVFFDRIAARADGKAELGSLYNPYWRVRLVAPTAADRADAAARQGGLELP